MNYINNDNSSCMSSELNKGNCFYKLSASECSASRQKALYNELNSEKFDNSAIQVDLRDQLQEPSHEMFPEESSVPLSISGMLAKRTHQGIAYPVARSSGARQCHGLQRGGSAALN